MGFPNSRCILNTFLISFIFSTAWCQHILNDDTLTRIEEKLTIDKDFYNQWMDLIALQ
ncbi:hypothetical protein CAEBREN_30058, partial [Caenorhabditis brenneri]